MVDTGNLPTMPSTVDLGGAGPAIEGDPLEFMRKIARENIESVNKNVIVNDKEKIEFKKYVLKELKTNITKFEEIDTKFAEQKEAEGKEEEPVEGEEGGKEEDPFADIFGGEEGGAPDEATKEKTTIAQAFASDVKIYKEQFLKKIRVDREKHQQKVDEQKMEEILVKLNQI